MQVTGTPTQRPPTPDSGVAVEVHLPLDQQGGQQGCLHTYSLSAGASVCGAKGLGSLLLTHPQTSAGVVLTEYPKIMDLGVNAP